MSLKIRKYRHTGYVYDMNTSSYHNYLADNIVVHNCGKKRYVMNVCDNEGVRYKEPVIKMTGIEAVRSSTPAVCREYIKNTLRYILETDETTTQEYIATVRDEFKSLSFHEVAFPRKVSFYSSKKDSYGNTSTKEYELHNNVFTKGTPIQVKGALLYNQLIVDKSIDKIYPKIEHGDKIKYSYLMTPNPTRQNVISCPEYLPKELNMEQYIDYDTQFQKAYLAPVENILNAIGWNSEHKPTLEDFFS